jgi:hypothetical protein
LLIGVQGALLSWTIVVVPVVAAFTATAAMSFNAGSSWADAGSLGSGLWVLGHFGWIALGEGASRAVVTLSPLGIALLSILALIVLSRVTSARGWPLIAGGLIGFLTVDALIGFLLADVADASAWSAMLGGAACALIGLLAANRGHNVELFGPRAAAMAVRLPPVLPLALRAAAILAASVLVGAGLLSLVMAVGGHRRFLELFDSLDSGLVGGAALVLLCLALMPNFVAWLISYTAGSGFAVGSGTHFSPFDLAGGTEPVLPLFGFIPTTDPPSWAWLALFVPIMAGLVVGWWLRRRLDLVWWSRALAGIGAALVGALILAGLTALAGGGIGPGRMQQVGASFWPLAAWLWLELGLAAAVTAALPPLLDSAKLARSVVAAWTGRLARPPIGRGLMEEQQCH